MAAAFGDAQQTSGAQALVPGGQARTPCVWPVRAAAGRRRRGRCAGRSRSARPRSSASGAAVEQAVDPCDDALGGPVALPGGSSGASRSSRVAPPRRRTPRAISASRATVTSSINSLAMRLRSRSGVAGSFHRRGKSVARDTDASAPGVVELSGVLGTRCSSSRRASSRARSLAFHSASRTSATSRVVGMGLHEAPPRQFRLPARPLDGLGAPGIGLVGARRQFVLHLERDGQRDRGHQFHQQRADGAVDAGAGHGLALCARGPDAVALADVVREPPDPGGRGSEPSCPGRTRRTRQAPAAAPAPRGAARGDGPRRGPARCRADAVDWLRRDPMRCSRDARRAAGPSTRRSARAATRRRRPADAAAGCARRVGTRVARIVQHLQDARVLQRLPVQFAPARPAAEAARGSAAPRRGSAAPWRWRSRCGRRCRTASAGTVAPGHPGRARPGRAGRRPVPPAAAPSGPRAAPGSAGRRAAGRGACAARPRSWCP